MHAITEIALDAALIAATSAGAAWLAEHKELEPDWTWLEVGLGVAVTLTHAGAQMRRAGGSWQVAERIVWRSFAIAAPPIVIGEVAQWLRRRAEREQYKRQRQ
jgi:hypothetical protein